LESGVTQLVACLTMLSDRVLAVAERLSRITCMGTNRSLEQASQKTADDLRSIAHSQLIRELTPLTLPEVDAVIDLVARVLPAGNVPGMILNGLARLPDRRMPLNHVRRDINLLFKGVEQALDRAAYGAFFAGPAAVIWGYQNLLRLVGKNPDDAFPEGTWQFYVEYALRDDTARHANETHGFDTVLAQHRLKINPVDRMTAWVMAAVYAMHQYPALLENEWRERVYTFAMRELTAGTPQAARFKRLYRKWEAVRPYGRGSDVDPNEDYPRYRRRKFDQFIAQVKRELPAEMRRTWSDRISAEAAGLIAFQKQMSLLAYLEPGAYDETRVPIDLPDTQVGVIYRGHYYLLPVCAAGSTTPIDYATIRGAIAALVREPATTGGASLTSLAGVKRRAQAQLRGKLNAALVEEIDRLRRAPIVLNFDRQLPAAEKIALSDIRQGERGVGDHALTIFDTGSTFVFDQSHIFFDGGWGAALAEIMTNEALAWAVFLSSRPAPVPSLRPATLALAITPVDSMAVAQAPHVAPEVCVETRMLDLKAITALRQLFRKRSDQLELTVNDLLVLYRAVHAATYQPDPQLVADLRDLMREPKARAAAQAALEALTSDRQMNPAILIPVDASQHEPRERVYPMTFEVPLKEFDLLQLHTRAMSLLESIRTAEGADRLQLYAEFDQVQRRYLATLAGFGALMSRTKEIALTGESASVGTIKLLAHMPPALQRLLDKVPGKIDILNDLIKGREVFSNVGQVARKSTLTRFATAKDDNDKKTLAWGVMTDAQGVMHLTLRDFRPHVGQLSAIGLSDTARRLAQDYVDAYARGLNRYIKGLQHITLASHTD
jgi:hypothetical protein